MKFTVPDAWVLYFFPVLFGVSLIGCIAGTYSAPPTDEETLISFYTRVRPWGWWKPIEEKALARYPHIQPNKNVKRDAFNVVIEMGIRDRHYPEQIMKEPPAIIVMDSSPSSFRREAVA